MILQDQNYGIEIEFTGITRREAAKVVSDYFGTNYTYDGGSYDAYAVFDPELIAGRHILLVDDIVTTSVTLSECARALLADGAESVVCATIASA